MNELNKLINRLSKESSNRDIDHHQKREINFLLLEAIRTKLGNQLEMDRLNFAKLQEKNCYSDKK